MEIIHQITSSVWGIAAAIVLLGLCIFFHEAGHFLVAKASKMRVDQFSLGFGPPIFGFTRGETYYSINWVPIGGYVKIAGMEPGEVGVERGFHTRPRWMGALTILAGVTMNLVLAVLLYTVTTYFQGVPLPGSPGSVVGKVFPGTPASRSALQPGDQMVAMDGYRQGMTVAAVAPGSPAAQVGIKADDRLLQVGDKALGATVDVAERLAAPDGRERRVVFVDSTESDPLQAVRTVTLPALPPPASPLTPATTSALLQKHLGLTFKSLDQSDVVNYTALRPKKTIMVTVRRGGAEVQVPVATEPAQARVPMVTADGKLDSPIMTIGRMGVALTMLTQPVSLLTAAKIGAFSALDAVASVYLALHGVISGQIAAAPGGPVQIVAMTYQQAQLGWTAVAQFGGFLSANLAVFNLLPIPPLDGFVLLQLGFEAAIRRRIDARLEYYVKVTGFVLLMVMIAAFTFNDLANLIRHGTP